MGDAALGLALGAAQWWVLRPSFSLSPRWIFISMISGAIGLASGMQVAGFLPAMPVNDPIQRDSATVFAAGTALGVAISGLLFGLALGLAQWWLLRPQVTGAAWWIVANAIR